MPIGEDDPRLAKCGFAKLQGEGIEVYVRKYTIYLGRKSKSTNLDVVLGDHKNISRKHACIRYNFEKGVFELVVLGKNGVTVRNGLKGVLHTAESPPTELRSQDMIQMGDKSFYFLLPKDASRLGPPAAKQRRICQRQYPASQMTPPNANGSNFDSGPSRRRCVPGSMSDQRNLAAGADFQNDISPAELHMSASPRTGEYDRKIETGRFNHSVDADTGRKRKLSELSTDPQDLVFTHPSPLGVQGAHLYHPGGLA